MTQQDETGPKNSAADAASQRHGLEHLCRSVLACTLMLATVLAYPAQSQVARRQRPDAASTLTSASSLNAPSSEGRMLADQQGVWAVTETAWSKPGAKPVVTGNLIAERRLAGNLLEETLRSTSDATILRLDFLTFNRVEGRWEYMSFDTRAAVGIMTAQSYGRENHGKIELIFQPFAMPGSGAVEGNASANGQMVRMRQDIVRIGQDHITKDQYFTLADGVGGEWLAHRYDALRTR